MLTVEAEEQINYHPWRERDWEAHIAGRCPTYHTCTGGHQIVRCSGGVYCRCGVYMDSFLLVRFVEIKKKEDEE